MIKFQLIVLCLPFIVMAQIPIQNYDRYKEYVISADNIGKFGQPVIIPLAYAPRDVCFNPQLRDYISHLSPIPKPNVYYTGKQNTIEFGGKPNTAGKTTYNPLCQVFGICPGYVPVTNDMSSQGYYIQQTEDLNQSPNNKPNSQSYAKTVIRPNKRNNGLEKNNESKNTENRINPVTSKSNEIDNRETKSTTGTINKKTMKQKQQENLVKLMNYLIDHGRRRRTIPRISNNQSHEKMLNIESE